MKKLLILILFIAGLITSGCDRIFEDESECPPPVTLNLILNLSNTDNDGAEIFSRTIDKVEIFLFDDSDHLAYRLVATQAEVTAKSVSLNVIPGTYRVVCWGNAKANSSIMVIDGGPFADGYIHQSPPVGGVVAESWDPIYFAPYDRANGQFFIVPASGTKEVDVRFRAAHIKMDFKVEGYATATGEVSNPFIEVTNFYPKYDFSMGHLTIPAMNYRQQTSATQSRADDISYAYFNTPRFEQTNPTVINISKTAASASLKSLVLTDELIAKNIDPANIIELTIPIVIRFFDNANITIEIEKWGGEDVDPDLE